MAQGCFCSTGTLASKLMNFLKLRLLGKGADESEHTASRISTASKNSTKDDFFTKFPLKNIVELLDVEQEEEGWWYLGYRSCRKKVVKSSDIVDLESDTLPNPSAGANEWWCSKCKATVTSIKSQFRLQVRVQGETGTISVSFFNDEGDGFFPPEIMEMVDKKFVFKVSIDGKNKEKVMPIFNVFRLSNDPDIIQYVCAAATPAKPENEATSSKVANVMPFDLDSQTDENTTPKNGLKNEIANVEQSPTKMTSQEKRKAEAVGKPVLAYQEENSATKKPKSMLEKP
ncbi:nucleic acid-binding, OB-fold protein [Artemisia annua]|uniref:Nucleic acid-binding, OB-fold protein n=1 Tax=Artemisia annua TaxID=35608 RepID=A0A2U1KH47_ARTAN|nr:nucleic acid-binding, OB-fold protein [Artemisia annua]